MDWWVEKKEENVFFLFSLVLKGVGEGTQTLGMGAQLEAHALGESLPPCQTWKQPGKAEGCLVRDIFGRSMACDSSNSHI